MQLDYVLQFAYPFYPNRVFIGMKPFEVIKTIVPKSMEIEIQSPLVAVTGV